MVKRIIEAIEKIEKNDFENALIQISIGIDGVAKLKYPGLRTTERSIKLVEEYRDFIYRFSTLGQVSIGENGNNKFAGEFEGKTLGEILYKVIRCGLLHEGKLPADNSLVFDIGYGIAGFRTAGNITNFGFLISRSLLLSLCLIIIENDNSEDYKELNVFNEFQYGKKTIRIDNKMWNEDNLTERLLQELEI
jgi:hypothetical protein